MKRAAPFRKDQKENLFFSRKLSPREKQLFPACESRAPSVPPKYRLDIDRVSSSKRQQLRLQRPTKRPICLSETNPEFSQKVFPPLSREHRRRRSRLTCCRITGSTLAECPLASYLSSSPYFALPGSLFNPRPTEQRNRMSHGGTRR